MAVLAFIAVLALGLASAVSGQVAGCNGLGSTAQATLIKAISTSVPCAAGLPPYAGGGSPLGQASIKAGKYDYALSDYSVQPGASNVANVAYAIGLGSIYAKPTAAIRGPKISGCGLAAIYATPTGVAWNNPLVGVVGVTAVAIPIHRIDASGTTYTFTNMLAKLCKPRWPYQTVEQLSTVLPALYGNTINGAGGKWSLYGASGSAGVVAKFSTSPPGVIAYVSTNAAIAPFESPLGALASPGYFYSRQVNWAALSAAQIVVGTATEIGFPDPLDVTAVRGVYPFAFTAFFLGDISTLRPGNKACVKALCACLLSTPAQNFITSQASWHALSPSLVGAMTARCALV